jgi:hypothetical protein
MSRSAAQPRVSNSGLTRARPAASSAAAGLELRPDPGQTRREQRRRGRTGRRAVRSGQAQIGDRPAPAVRRPGEDDQVRLAPDKATAEEIAGGGGLLRRAATGVGDVQAAEPDRPAVAQRDVEALIDADRLDPAGGPAASRKGGSRRERGRQRHAGDTKPHGSGA